MFTGSEEELKRVSAAAAAEIINMPIISISPQHIESVLNNAFKDVFTQRDEEWVERVAKLEEIGLLADENEELKNEIKELREALDKEREICETYLNKAMDDKGPAETFRRIKANVDKSIVDRANAFADANLERWKDMGIRETIRDAYGNGAAEQEAIMRGLD